MKDSAEKILDFKRQIKSAETELHQAEGSQKEVLRGLKEMGLNDIQAADKEIDKLNKEMERLEQKETQIIESLEKGYEWN